MYLIDQDSRTNIHEANFIKLADANDEFVAFESGSNQLQSTLNIYDVQTGEFYELPYKVMPGNFKFTGSKSYFVSDSEECIILSYNSS